MPVRESRESLRKYNREWVARRRQEWITANGPCANCGSSENLEVDHVDPSQKTIHTRNIWSRQQEVRDAELAKCQVLCYDCHNRKTITENYRPRVHGTVAMYKRGKCRCELCKEAKRRYVQQENNGATLIFVRPSDLRRLNA